MSTTTDSGPVPMASKPQPNPFHMDAILYLYFLSMLLALAMMGFLQFRIHQLKRDMVRVEQKLDRLLPTQHGTDSSKRLTR